MDLMDSVTRFMIDPNCLDNLILIDTVFKCVIDQWADWNNEVEQCPGQCWVKLSTVHCSGQCWVKLSTFNCSGQCWVKAEHFQLFRTVLSQSWALSGTALSQAEWCPGLLWVKFYFLYPKPILTTGTFKQYTRHTYVIHTIKYTL